MFISPGSRLGHSRRRLAATVKVGPTAGFKNPAWDADSSLEVNDFGDSAPWSPDNSSLAGVAIRKTFKQRSSPAFVSWTGLDNYCVAWQDNGAGAEYFTGMSHWVENRASVTHHRVQGVSPNIAHIGSANIGEINYCYGAIYSYVDAYGTPGDITSGVIGYGVDFFFDHAAQITGAPGLVGFYIGGPSPDGLCTQLAVGLEIGDWGAVGPDPNNSLNIWSIGGYNLFTGHSSFGNQLSFGQDLDSWTVSINDKRVGNFGSDYYAGLQIGQNWQNTDPVVDGSHYPVLPGLDVNPEVTAASTGYIGFFPGIQGSNKNRGQGTVDSMYALYFYASDYGDGNITNSITGIECGAFADKDTGSIGQMWGAFIRSQNFGAITVPLGVGGQFGIGGDFTDAFGLIIQDAASVGSAQSYNIYSQGTRASGAPALASTAGGNLFVNHSAFGNYVDIDKQPIYGSVPAALSIGEKYSGDLSGVGGSAVSGYVMAKHTGTSPSEGFVGGDFEAFSDGTNTGDIGAPGLNGITGVLAVAENDGTGDIGWIAGVFGNAFNFENANIAYMSGLYYSVISTAGVLGGVTGCGVYLDMTGSVVTDLYGLSADGLIGDDVTNAYGLRVADCSGVGSSKSYNIYSEGTRGAGAPALASTLGGNLFVGHTAIGNYADVDSIVYAPGDPTNETTGPLPAALIVNDFQTGDFSADNVFGFGVEHALRHTGGSEVAEYTAFNMGQTVTSNSTGPFHFLKGGGISSQNFGSGAIDEQYGLVIECDNIGSADITSQQAGELIFMYNDCAGGTVTLMKGVSVFPWIVNGSVDTINGLEVYLQIDGGAVGSYRGLSLFVPSVAGGTLTSSIGLYIQDHGAGRNILSEGANSNNKFEGNILLDNYMELTERADPSAPASNKARLYTKDNGSGKTQLVVVFPTGAVQVIATEP